MLESLSRQPLWLYKKARSIGSLSLQRGQESVYGFVICGSNTHTKLPAYTRLLSSKLLPKKSALNSLLEKKKKKDEIFQAYCVIFLRAFFFFFFPVASLKCSGSSPDTKCSRLLHLVTLSLITAHSGYVISLLFT